MVLLSYEEVKVGASAAIPYSEYKAKEELLKKEFASSIQPLDDRELLLAYLSFKKLKLEEETARSAFVFFSHLEDLFQAEFASARRNNLKSLACCTQNNTEDGTSSLEKRMIKRFKCIKRLDDLKLIERFIILVNRKTEKQHAAFAAGLEGVTPLTPQQLYELKLEEAFLKQEFENRGLSIPAEKITALEHNCATFIGA